jgi:acetylornithine deacetylase/succinyl-diaminopimelate desuccinylase-like protein
LLAAAAAIVSTPVVAAPSARERAALSTAVKAGHAASVKRLQDWIALPTIANMGMNHKEGAEYMRRLALDAGFSQAKVITTDGVPGVFATLDAGAPTTLAIYFMYDVKHFDPAEWSSPPLEARIVDRPGEGKAIVGRGAVNQKGPETAFLSMLHAFKASNTKLPVNLVLVAEGEEEIGSTHFSQIVLNPDVKPAIEKAVGVIIPSASQGPDGDVT